MAPKRAVLLTLIFGGMLYVSAYGLEYTNEQNGKRIANPLPKLGGIEVAVGWAFLALILYGMAEIPPTAELAQAFALLILLSLLFTYGVEAFTNLLVLMGYEEGESIDNGGETSRSTRERPQ